YSLGQEVLLLGGIDFDDVALGCCVEAVQHGAFVTSEVTDNGAVAVPEVRVLPFTDNAEPSRIGKQVVDVVDQNDIEIEKQCHALEPAKARCHQSELGPVLPELLVEIDGWHGLALDLRPYAG